MKKNYQYLIGAAALIIIISLAWFLRPSAQKDSLEFWQSGKPTESTVVRVIRTPAVIRAVSEAQSKNEDFLACTQKELQACASGGSDSWKIQLGGGFQEQVDMLLPLLEKDERLDNCIADRIAACQAESLRVQMSKKPDLALCDRYSEAVEKQNCLNETYPKVAIDQDNVTVCEQSNDPYYRTYCADTYLADKSVKNRDVTWCTKLSSPDRQGACRNQFPQKLALATGDISLCNGAASPEAGKNCMQSFIMQKMDTKSIEGCKKVYDYSGAFSDKPRLDQIHHDCLNQLSNSLLEWAKKEPTGAIADTYKKVCDGFDEIEKNSCLAQLQPPPIPVVVTPSTTVGTGTTNATGATEK